MAMTIHVRLRATTDRSYPITIGKHLAACAREILRSNRRTRYFIVTDSNVEQLYGTTFRMKMNARKGTAFPVIVPPGERSKSRVMKNFIEDRLLSLGANRDSIIIALGGGVIGDLAGFVAATFQRGIPCIHIPTTLLAQVDSSIGGKVGIDLPHGKNLIGAFSQPKQVFIDPTTLLTLSNPEFMNGMAEVIKYGAILDRSFFQFLERALSDIKRRHIPTLTKIISRCCELKYRVVSKDEREHSYRRILNFGHTIGHAIENVHNYRLSHGRAVAIGMCVEAKLSVALGLLSRKDYERLNTLITSCGLPTTMPRGAELKQILQSTRHDKKIRDGVIRYTLLDKIGKGHIDVPLSSAQALRILRS